MTVGERIKDLRLKLGISQVNFADKTKVSKQTLYKYENNIITNIPSDKIELMAKILNTTPAYLMGWCEDIFEEMDLFEEGLAMIGWRYEMLSDCDGSASVCNNDSMNEYCADCKYLTTYYYLTNNKKYYKISEAEFNSLSQCILPYLRFRIKETLSGKTGLSEREYKFVESLLDETEDPTDELLNAAHDDEASTPEERQAGDDIMMDDSEWE